MEIAKNLHRIGSSDIVNSYLVVDERGVTIIDAGLSGYWPLLRYSPDLVKQGLSPLQLDSRAPSIPLEKFIYNDTRYTMLKHSNPDEAKRLLGNYEGLRGYRLDASVPARRGGSAVSSTTPRISSSARMC